jgi:hypothetical protein
MTPAPVLMLLTRDAHVQSRVLQLLLHDFSEGVEIFHAFANAFHPASDFVADLGAGADDFVGFHVDGGGEALSFFRHVPNVWSAG